MLCGCPLCLRSTSLLRNSCPMVCTSVFNYFSDVLHFFDLFPSCISRLQMVPGTLFHLHMGCTASLMIVWNAAYLFFENHPDLADLSIFFTSRNHAVDLFWTNHFFTNPYGDFPVLSDIMRVNIPSMIFIS